jgi:hypothetical protein
MATLIEAALRVTQKLHDVYYGTATGGTTTTLVDTLCTEQQGYFNNGVMWLTSGSNIGEWVEIVSFGNGTFTFKSAVTPSIALGDKYAVIPDDLSRNLLRNVINEACKSVSKIYTSDSTLVVVANQEEYTLPTGVSDVRRVEVAENATSPYSYGVNAYWKENGGKLYFHPNHIPDQTAGNKIRLWYATIHPDLDDTSTLYWQVDDILWLAIIYVLQHDYIAHGEDHKWVVEMNRKAEEEQEKANRRLKRPPSKTPYLIGPFG